MWGAASAMDRVEVTLSRLIAPESRVTPCVSGRSSRLPALQTAWRRAWRRVAYGGTRVSVCAACPALWDVLCLSRERGPAADRRRTSTPAGRMGCGLQGGVVCTQIAVDTRF
jgi:hypothetical protein